MSDAEDGWSSLLSRLKAAAEAGDGDDFIDAWLEEAGNGTALSGTQIPGWSGDPTEFLIASLKVAKSESTQQDVAMVLARHGRRGDVSVSDALTAAYQTARGDASRGPGLLSVLALRAEQDHVAQPDLFASLLRITSADPRYLVIRATKIIGRFEGLGISTRARDRLREWADEDDPAVQGEARQQLALLALADALAQPDAAHVREALREARYAFARAELTEELRHDARLFGALLELFFAHMDTPGSGSEYSAAISGRALVLKRLLDDPSESSWPGYASPVEKVVEHRLYRIALGFLRVAEDVEEMEEWTNFDASLTELAATWHLMWQRAGDLGANSTLQKAEGVVGLPRLGSFLERAVGRQRMLRVLERHESVVGCDDPVSKSLRDIYEEATRAEHARATEGTTLTIGGDDFRRLAVQAPAAAYAVSRVVPGAEAMLKSAGLETAVEAAARASYPLPTDAPACFGNDPAVDETVRPLLRVARERVGPAFPLDRWRRFVDLTVDLIGIARDLRSDLPAFMRSADERQGKGQQASETDLQEYVFAALRQKYGRFVHWEPTRIAGGRSDSGAFFPEGAFPIEVKAEYRDVTREHLRKAYLGQADRYAGDRDRVSYLLVLDLREELARAERALYTLRESFWVDGLIPDPQITDAASNSVIVGLFPGNQPKPSTMTTYSRRPQPRQ